MSAANRKRLDQAFSGFSRRAASAHLPNLIFCESRRAVAATANENRQPERHRVPDIVARRNVLKILRSVICFDAVFVIDLHPGGSRSNECGSDVAMDRDGFVGPVAHESRGLISVSAHAKGENPNRLSLKTANAPLVRDFVQREFRNRTPFFGMLFGRHAGLLTGSFVQGAAECINTLPARFNSNTKPAVVAGYISNPAKWVAAWR